MLVANKKLDGNLTDPNWSMSLIEGVNKFNRIRIDVGLSFNAPFTKHWSEKYPDTLVIAIEPSLDSLSVMFSVSAPPYPTNSLLQLPPTGFAFLSQNRPILLNNAMFIPCALSENEWRHEEFFENTDPGTSSLYPPNVHTLRKSNLVTVTTIDSIFRALKIKQECIVEVLKIDTQGNDLKVLLGAEQLLLRTVFVQIEISTYGQYKNAPETFLSMDSLLRSKDFFMLHRDHRGDAIYLNRNLNQIANSIEHNLLDEI
jgi:FkbM family methyltransferase